MEPLSSLPPSSFQGFRQFFKGGDIYLKALDASLTAHNKMAAVKKSMRNNIIKMKLTEEKRYWNFCLLLFLAEVRLNVLGMCIT